jgi:micrococcal nuclease
MRGRALAICAVLLLAAAASARTALPAFLPGGTVEMGAVIDGGTLRLADGRVLQLVGIETPSPARRAERDLAARAKAALETLVAGKTLALRFAGNDTDRNGSVLAELFAGGRWVQRELVRRGLARVRGAADNRRGLAALLAVEDEARRAARGMWRLKLFAVRPAAEAARDAGTWQIVEGTVADVALVAGGAYVNFGPDWHTAFSLHIARDALKLVRSSGLDPRGLKGARLRVRGFIDGARRPTIEVSFPEQIERVAETSAARK